MRPIIRRDERGDLDTARHVVSNAERQALERAEELSREAQDLFDAATGAAAGAVAELTGRLASLEQEFRAVVAKASAQAEELGRLRAEQHQLKLQLERLQSKVDELPPAGRDPMETGSGQPGLALVDTAREVEKLLSAAMAAIETETERSVAMRAEAERIRLEAVGESERMIAAARAEAEEIRRRARSEGRNEGRAGLEEARRRLAEETAGLRVAMDQTWSTLEKLLDPPDHGSSRPD